MPWCHTNVGGESIHRDETTGVANAIHSRVHATINSANIDTGQDLLNDPCGIGGITRTHARRVELLRQRRGQRIECGGVPHQTILRLEKQRPSTVRRQPDADDGNATCRAQIERTQ